MCKKNYSLNVGEIDHSCIFHQHFTSSFCAGLNSLKIYKDGKQINGAQKITNSSLSTQKLMCKKLLVKTMWNRHLLSISPTFYEQFLCWFSVTKNLQTNSTHMKALQNYFLHESCSWNVGVRDTCSQFHQHFMWSFCADIVLPKSHKAKL